MRIPHHLIRFRSSSGRWSFRQEVPFDLHALLGRRVIKRTLLTTDLLQAQAQAIGLASSYAQIFKALRGLPLDRFDTKDVEALIERLTQERGQKDVMTQRFLHRSGR